MKKFAFLLIFVFCLGALASVTEVVDKNYDFGEPNNEDLISFILLPVFVIFFPFLGFFISIYLYLKYSSFSGKNLLLIKIVLPFILVVIFILFGLLLKNSLLVLAFEFLSLVINPLLTFRIYRLSKTESTGINSLAFVMLAIEIFELLLAIIFIANLLSLFSTLS